MEAVFLSGWKSYPACTQQAGPCTQATVFVAGKGHPPDYTCRSVKILILHSLFRQICNTNWLDKRKMQYPNIFRSMSSLLLLLIEYIRGIISSSAKCVPLNECSRCTFGFLSVNRAKNHCGLECGAGVSGMLSVDLWGLHRHPYRSFSLDEF